jgi:hypothetical protein
MMLFTVAYLASALVGAGALLYYAPALRKRWGNPQLAALCAALFLIAATFWFAAPATIRVVNRATGIANVSALIVYSLVTAFAAATLTFAMFWHYPPGTARPRVRWILVAYGGAIIAMAVLFASSDVPVERRTDFDTYYADQPTVAAFLLVYLVSTLIGASYLARQLLRWARPPDPRNGAASAPQSPRALYLFAIAIAFPIAFDAIKIAAVVANWFDLHALDDLSTAAPLLNVVAVVLAIAAVIRARGGPRRTAATT